MDVKTLAFPDKLDLATLPTALEPLDRLSDQLGGPRIWIKRDDLTGCAHTGNKVRKLEYTFHRAIAQGADTIITCGGLQSNHCRATAVLGARLGLKVHLLLRGQSDQKPADGNLFLNFLCGAQVTQIETKKYQTELPSIIDDWKTHYQEQGKKAYVIPTGASDGVGAWGYINCVRELSRQIQQQNIQPSVIFHATGSGGTQAGLTVGAHMLGLGADVVGMAVCDDEAYFKSKVREDLEEWSALYDIGIDLDQLSINVNDNYVGPGYGKAGPEVFKTIQELAALEGVILDPVYSGKAFHGMVSEIKKGTYHGVSDVVFVHTGGIFGLFAQREQLAF